METSCISVYQDTDFVTSSVAARQHREIVGGMWDDIGRLQFEVLRHHGLLPEHRLVDIGCGCLRGGVHFVRYLAPGNYYGVDLNQSLLDAGYDIELRQLGLQDRLPRQNLLCSSHFEFDRFTTKFDVALALSVFTHLPLNSIRTCLERLSTAMVRGGRFFASFSVVPDDRPAWPEWDQGKGGVITYGDRDPYHYRIADMEYAALSQPWRTVYFGHFAHPRNQMIMIYERLT